MSAIYNITGGSDGKEPACYAGDLGSIPRLERSPGEGNGTPLQFLPGEFHGQRSLAGCSAWGCKESDLTEQLTLAFLGFLRAQLKFCHLH